MTSTLQQSRNMSATNDLYSKTYLLPLSDYRFKWIVDWKKNCR